MTLLNYLTLTFSTVALALTSLSCAYMKAAEWHLEQARLWRTSPEQAKNREAAAPWYVAKLPYEGRLSGR